MCTKPKRINDAGKIQSEKFYSVEFMIEGFPYLFQFKIWSTPEMPMFILVKESSDIISWLREGDVIKLKYYSYALNYPAELETEIESISLKDHGRFRGHYAVGLKILCFPSKNTR